MRNTARSSALWLALALVFLLVGVPALAQETVGSIGGIVTSDADGEALPGVTVVAKNDATGAERLQVTDGQGRYRFLNLAVGSYTLTASLEGFQSLETDLVRVSLGATATVNIALPAGDLEETITVTSEAPLVDVSSTVSGVTVNVAETFDKVPIVREVTQVALLAPGSTGGDAAFSSVNRTYTPGQSAVSLSGSSIAENNYLLNGLNLTNFRNGIGASNVPVEFVEEVQVKTGGYEAEFGRSTGGVLNMVSKSGANDFHGAVNGYFTPDSLRQEQPDYYNALNSVEERDRQEINLSLGGPFYKDRAFFFGFYQFNDNERLDNILERNEVRKVDDPFYGGKIDINLTSSHRLEGTYFTDNVTVKQETFTFDTATRRQGGSLGTGTYDAGGDNMIGKYTGIFGSSFVAAVQYGTNDFNRTLQSAGDSCPSIYDSRDGGLTPMGCWVNFQRGSAKDERDASRIDLDYFVGGHSIRGGYDDETNTSFDLTEYSGGEYFRYFAPGFGGFNTGNNNVVRYRIFQGGGNFDTISSAYYLQDSWEVNNRLLVNYGVRVETFDNKNAIGESFIKEDGQYAPRLGVTYDLSGDGRSKIYASAGRYHLYIASNTNIRLAGAEYFLQEFYVMKPGCDLVNPTFDTCNGQLLQSSLFGDGEVPDVRATKSDKVDPMYLDEYAVGYERMVGNDWSLGARVVSREMSTVIEDITIDAAMTAQGLPGFGAFEYRLTNPGEDFNGYVDVGNGLQRFSATAAELGYPAPERNYYAVELTANKRFSNHWQFRGNYTWSHSYGNYEGYVRSDNGQDDAGITTLYDFAGLLDGAYGNLPNDRRHNVKLWGAYGWDNGFYLGAAASYHTGRPINAFGVHPTDPFAALYDNESFYDQGTLVPRGTRGTTDSITNVDLTAKYDFDIAKGQITVRADVFNVFDSSNALEVHEQADEPTGIVDVHYKEATVFQSPQTVRLMVGWSF